MLLEGEKQKLWILCLILDIFIEISKIDNILGLMYYLNVTVKKSTIERLLGYILIIPLLN